MSKSIVLDKAITFALRVVKLYRYLTEEKKEYVLSKQILISGTYIAKFVKAATQSEDRPGFASNMNSVIRVRTASGSDRAPAVRGWKNPVATAPGSDRCLTAIVKTSKENV